MRTNDSRVLTVAAILLGTTLGADSAGDRVRTASGIVEGAGPLRSGVRPFKGIPFAAPPLGERRWKEPQAVAGWQGVRAAVQFGPRCMQLPIFSDMKFRSSGMSEDCLYLNVWTPARSDQERLPVLVYFFGGGFQAGDASEPRYDGESMAAKGLVAVTVNYRLSVFGFLAHPELTREPPHRASGNYGLLDQSAALLWVRQNIAAFGGDPKKVTIAGESAGSISVSAQMASPLSKALIAGAIGESGALMGPRLPPPPLPESEKTGIEFAAQLGAPSLAALRAVSAERLLAALANDRSRFGPNLDGYFLPKLPEAVFEAGEQAKVPLLAGWNSEESSWRGLLRDAAPTPQNYAKAVRSLYGERADEVLKLYPASTPEQMLSAAIDLAGDRFIAFSTWKWLDRHARTSGRPTYRYYFARPRPPKVPEATGIAGGPTGGGQPGVANTGGAAPRGAAHSAEIEYAMGNLASNDVYAWSAEDFKVSQVMQDYFANFVRTGDPNGPGLPRWPKIEGGGPAEVLRIDVETRAQPEPHRARYLLLDRLSSE